MVQIQHACGKPNIKHFKSLTSTNTVAREMVDKGHQSPLWIIADKQTDGRGRHGRSWISDLGNLYASMAIKCPADTPNISGLSLLAGLALVSAIKQLQTGSDQLNIILKWPNDLVIGQAKLGGILIENYTNSATQSSDLIFGFGLNIASSPHLTERKTCALQDFGCNIPRDEIVSALILQMEKWLTVWQKGRNFSEIRLNWLVHAGPIGERTSVKHFNKIIKGQYIGLDEQGSLQLKMPTGEIETISCGELIA